MTIIWSSSGDTVTFPNRVGTQTVYGVAKDASTLRVYIEMNYHTDAVISQFSIKEVTNDLVGYWGLDADNSISALSFDGNNDVITTSADSTRADATYTYWAKFASGNTDEHVFGHGGSTKTTLLLNAGGSSNQPLLYMAGPNYTYWADTPAQDDDIWHHWVVVMDSSSTSSCKLYIDGVIQTLSSSGQSGESDAYTTGLQIGGSGAGYAEGSITQFAVYSDLKDASFALSQYNKGIDADWSSDSNISGYWKMDSASTVTDLSSNSNNGSVSGATLVDNAVALDSTSNNNDGTLV